jgi:RNA polymerase sigma factor (sigma-70 family)
VSDGDFTSLLERVRQGDQTAFADLVARYEPEVRIIARVMLGPLMRSHLDSGDIVQSVHRSLLRGLRAEKFKIESPQQLIALAVQMARRKVAHQWRRLKRQERLADPDHVHDSLADFLASLVSPEIDPARAAEMNEAIRRMNEELPAPDRRLMELRLQGYSTVEAAQLLQTDPDALRVRLSRLRQKLRACGLFDDWL